MLEALTLEMPPRWVLEVAFAAYALIVGVLVVLERRRPTATLALLLALIFLPVIGLVTYLLLSRRRIQRQRNRRRRRPIRPVDQTRHLANLESMPSDILPSQRKLVLLALNAAAAPLRRCHEVELLPTAGQALEALETAIAGAQRCVHAEFYIWRDDTYGRRITQRLTERARAGVKVRVLYDHLGSIALPDRHFAELREAGGEVAAFGRLRLPRLRRRLNYRNHRKILTVDGRIGFLGGLNIGDEYLDPDKDRSWRDLHVELNGDGVLGLEATFLEDWIDATGEVVDLEGERHSARTAFDARRPLPKDRPWSRRRRQARAAAAAEADPFAKMPDRPVASEGPLLQVIPSGPDTEVAGIIGAQMTAAIASATRRVWIATPYFIPDEPLTLMLRTAALSGIDVRLMVPRGDRNDSRIVAWAARSYYTDIMVAGVRIFEYEPGMLHAKYLIVDDVCAIGSANMDVRSFYLNYEVTAMFYDRALTESLGKIFLHDLEHDSREVKRRRSASLRARVAESFARLLSPLL